MGIEGSSWEVVELLLTRLGLRQALLQHQRLWQSPAPSITSVLELLLDGASIATSGAADNGSGSARSLVISFGLKDHSQGTLKDIVAAIMGTAYGDENTLTWANGQPINSYADLQHWRLGLDAWFLIHSVRWHGYSPHCYLNPAQLM